MEKPHATTGEAAGEGKAKAAQEKTRSSLVYPAAAVHFSLAPPAILGAPAWGALESGLLHEPSGD